MTSFFVYRAGRNESVSFQKGKSFNDRAPRDWLLLFLSSPAPSLVAERRRKNFSIDNCHGRTGGLYTHYPMHTLSDDDEYCHFFSANCRCFILATDGLKCIIWREDDCDENNWLRANTAQWEEENIKYVSIETFSVVITLKL